MGGDAPSQAPQEARFEQRSRRRFRTLQLVFRSGASVTPRSSPAMGLRRPSLEHRSPTAAQLLDGPRGGLRAAPNRSRRRGSRPRARGRPS